MENKRKILKFSDSNLRLAIAGAVVVALILLDLLAVMNEGIQPVKAFLILFLTLLAGAFILAEFKIPRAASALLIFVIPFLALCCVEFYTHKPWDLTFLITLLNYLFFLFLYLMMCSLCGGSRWGIFAATLFSMIIGAANYFVIDFRSSPIVPWDFYSVGTAASVMTKYTFEISYRFLFVILGFTYMMILGHKTDISFRRWQIRLGTVAVSVLLMTGFVFTVQTEKVADDFGLDEILFTPKVLYRNNGFAVAFLSNIRYLKVEKPEQYSVETVEQIERETQSAVQEVSASVDEPDGMPNIIVIMNEGFSDLSVYGEFGTNEDYMPFIRSLQKNTVKGNLYMSVKGGNTANSEFEFLTGNSMAFLPAGSVPYQQFINEETPSIVSHLNSLGYRTHALHPYYSSGWNRDKVYPYFGFDHKYFSLDFTNSSRLRDFVDDKSAFNKIIDLYEEKQEGEKMFAFEVTMQNHGGYSQVYSDLNREILLTDIDENEKATNFKAVENYLTLIKKTDEAFEDFIKYFEGQVENTIVLMFGDHQPSDYITGPVWMNLGKRDWGSGLEELSLGYIVPFVMWANYDIEEEEIDQISANYLGGLLMEKANLPKTDYQTYLTELQERYPVITANFYVDKATGEFRSISDGKLEQDERYSLNAYSILQYNYLCDTKQRNKTFFGG